MNSISVFLIICSVTLSVIAQILLKYGMSNPVIQESFRVSLLSGILSVIGSYYVLAGLASYVSSAAIWLGVLARVDVSRAYPFVGLGFIGTMLFAYWFLNEPLTLSKVLGTLLIVAGVLLISK